MRNSEGIFNPSSRQPGNPKQHDAAPDERREAKRTEELERAEKFISDAFQANADAANLYLANNEFNPWSIDDLVNLQREYHTNPVYKEKFLQAFAPYFPAKKVGRDRMTTDFLNSMPSSLHQRLLGHAICITAKEQGVLNEEDVVPATDLVSMGEYLIDNMNLDSMPNIWEKRREIYFQLKQKLGEEALQELKALCLAGNVLCWLVTTEKCWGATGSFTPEDVVELAKQLQSDSERARQDLLAFDTAFTFWEQPELGRRREERWEDYYDKIQTPFLKRMLRQHMERYGNNPQGYISAGDKIYKELSKHPARDLSHIKLHMPYFEGFEKGEGGYEDFLQEVVKMIKQKPRKS